MAASEAVRARNDEETGVESESETEEGKQPRANENTQRGAVEKSGACARESEGGEEKVSHDDERDVMRREGAWCGGEEPGGFAPTTDQIHEQQKKIDGERGAQPPEQLKKFATQRRLKGGQRHVNDETSCLSRQDRQKIRKLLKEEVSEDAAVLQQSSGERQQQMQHQQQQKQPQQKEQPPRPQQQQEPQQ